MKTLNKMFVLIIGGLFAIFTMPGLSYMVEGGPDEDNFTITMTGRYLECNIINASWNIGLVLANHQYWTNQTGETEKADTSNSTDGDNLDFEMFISSDAAVWKTVWAENYTTGPNQYKLNASSDAWASQTALNITNYADVKANFAPDTNASFDLRLNAPTSITVGTQQTITLTGRVTIH